MYISFDQKNRVETLDNKQIEKNKFKCIGRSGTHKPTIGKKLFLQLNWLYFRL